MKQYEEEEEEGRRGETPLFELRSRGGVEGDCCSFWAFKIRACGPSFDRAKLHQGP